MEQMLGSVVGVTGSRIMVRLEPGQAGGDAARVGAMVKVRCGDSDVVGSVGEVHAEAGPPPRDVLVVDLLGEIVASAHGGLEFNTGVAHHPGSGATVLSASDADLAAIYAPAKGAALRVGGLSEDTSRPAYVMMDELLGKHFAVLGTTGSGKSCAVTLILSAILADHPNAHIVLLDPHNEYSKAFGGLAEVIDIENLQLPFWLLDFEEAVRVLVRGGTVQEQEAQAIILKDAIIRARRQYATDGPSAASITVDTPAPYRISDLLRMIYDSMGRLDKPDTSVPYLRLRTRFESLRDDRRFAFMFSERLVTRDTLSQIIGRMLRIPSNGIPLSIIDLSGLPSEITDVVVSVLCRMLFDFILWSDYGALPPVLLVCEEAHRYVPADERIGFAAAARAITRISKEGRKYGISLGLVSQRPAELSPSALSQCGTIFALRLGNELDQRFVSTLLPEASRGMLAALPSLRPQEAVVSGEGVPLPLRVRFDDLPPERRPRSEGAEFAHCWSEDAARTAEADSRLVEEGVRRWRLQSRSRKGF